MKTRVYLAFDTDGALLYVGHTKLAMKQRMACHRQEDKVWPQRMARLELVEFDDPNEARSVERNLIADLEPLYNVQGNPRHNPEWYEVDLPETAEMYADFMRGAA